MRSRIIKPEFFEDSTLGRMPDGARLLFIGLWTLADREGRLADSPMMIAGSIWPHRDDGILEDVRRWLEMLAAANYIIRYQVNGNGYIQIRTFTRHQPIHPNEKKSRIPPPPPQCNDDVGECRENVITSPGQCHDISATMSGQRRDNVITSPGQCQDNAVTMSRSRRDIVTPTSTITSTSTSAAIRKLPNTPIPPTDDSPPPLTPVEKPVEISPTAAQQPGNGKSPPLTDPKQAIAILAERRAMEPRQRRAPPAPADAAGIAAGVVARMLSDWMEHRADALGPPDDALCRRLLEAHGMSLERVRDWLLGLRRRGKHPGSVQGWGWFVALAEADRRLVAEAIGGAAGGVA